MPELKDLINDVFESNKSNEKKTEEILELFSVYSRKPLDRIVERLEILYDEAQDKLSDNFIYYDGWGDGVDMATRVVKEEGGMNE